MSELETSYDVLVVGTGASGMSAAVTAAYEGLKVLVVDKAPVYGGTTARSGGWLWIPGTKLAKEQGISEPAGAAPSTRQAEHHRRFHFSKLYWGQSPVVDLCVRCPAGGRACQRVERGLRRVLPEPRQAWKKSSKIC